MSLSKRFSQRFTVFIVGICSLLAVTSCGPVYRTNYRLIAPPDMQGKNCTRNCQSQRDLCDDMLRMAKENCELREKYDQLRCEDALRRQRKKVDAWSCSTTSSCPIDEERCQTRFHECFQFCGGEVIPEQVCVFNCNQAP